MLIPKSPPPDDPPYPPPPPPPPGQAVGVKTRRRCGCRRLLCAAAVCLLLAGGLCAVLFAVILPALSDTPDAGSSTAAGEDGEWFRVVSGPCTTSENGRCVGRPDGYAAFEVCEIAVGRVGGRALLLSSN